MTAGGERGMGFGPDMMKDMMEKMMAGKGGIPMMDQCMQMCDKMGDTIKETLGGVAYGTPELRTLFEEWVKEIQLEMTAFLKEKGMASPSEIATKMKISEESVLYLALKMAQEKKIKIISIGL